VPDARDQLTGAAQASAFAQELGSGIDYLIGCEARTYPFLHLLVESHTWGSDPLDSVCICSTNIQQTS